MEGRAPIPLPLAGEGAPATAGAGEGSRRLNLATFRLETPLIRHAPHDTFSRKREKGTAFIFGALLLFAALPAHAVEPDEMLANPVLESRARDISAGLRCLVCQNQSIDDSEAPLARDLRKLVRERLKQGDSDAQVRDYLVARYGPYILLKPPFDMKTLLLWLTPAFCLGIGLVAMVVLRRRTIPSPAAPLDAAETAAVERILSQVHRDG